MRGKKLQEGRIRLEDTLSAVTSRVLSKRKAEALRKRFVSHQDEIFTFLSRPEVEPTNNFAERQIRPAVMMSLIQTEKLQGKNPKDLLLSLVLDNQPTTGPP
ncbi:MAG: transposase [Candidatus Omnitrophota bacterium]